MKKHRWTLKSGSPGLPSLATGDAPTDSPLTSKVSEHSGDLNPFIQDEHGWSRVKRNDAYNMFIRSEISFPHQVTTSLVQAKTQEDLDKDILNLSNCARFSAQNPSEPVLVNGLNSCTPKQVYPPPTIFTYKLQPAIQVSQLHCRLPSLCGSHCCQQRVSAHLIRFQALHDEPVDLAGHEAQQIPAGVPDWSLSLVMVIGFN